MSVGAVSGSSKTGALGSSSSEFGLPGAVPEKADICGEQQHADDVEGGVREHVLDPADAVVHDAGEDEEARDRHHEREQALAERGLRAPRQALEIGLERLEVDDVEERDVGNDRRQEGVLDHLRVGNADVLDHQERGRAHDRRHQLAVDGTRHFDRAGLVGPVADPLHQRNREGAGGDHVGDRGARDDSRGRRGHHRRLGRAAAHVTEQRERRLDEVVAGARLVEQRAEQHEEEDEARGNAQRDAEHALGGEPLVRHALGERGALVRDHVGHVRPAEDVGEEHDRDDRHRRSQRASRGLEQQDDADHRGHEVERRRLPGTRGELRIEQEDVARAERTDDGEDPVDGRNVGARRALERRIGDEAQEDREGEVDRARLSVVEDEDAEGERQGRGVPELEERPRERDAHQGLGDGAGRRAASHVGLGHQFLELGLVVGAVVCLLFGHVPSWDATDAGSCGLGRLEAQFGQKNRPGVDARPASARRTGYIQPFSL